MEERCPLLNVVLCVYLYILEMQNNRDLFWLEFWVGINDLKVRLHILYLEGLSYCISIGSLYLVSVSLFIEMILTIGIEVSCDMSTIHTWFSLSMYPYRLLMASVNLQKEFFFTFPISQNTIKKSTES